MSPRRHPRHSNFDEFVSMARAKGWDFGRATRAWMYLLRRFSRGQSLWVRWIDAKRMAA